jgi:hypothetical protein
MLGDGVRVLTGVMKKVTKIVGEVGTKLRDRGRSVKRRLMEIGRAARAKGPQSKEKLQKSYGSLLDSTSRVVGQALRFSITTRNISATRVVCPLLWSRGVSIPQPLNIPIEEQMK